jgi:hypothetical protein
MTNSLAFLGNFNYIHKNILSTKTTRRLNTNNIIRFSHTMNIPHLNGLDIGIPLNIIDNVFTNLHYGEDITTPKVILLQFLIGYYTYGKDRYKDALEYYDNLNSEKNDSLGNSFFEIKDKKKHLYKIFYDNAEFYDKSYSIVFYSIIFILLNDNFWYLNLPTIALLYSTDYYKELKGTFVGFKPFFVASMWTFSAIVLPSVLHDHDYSILTDTADYLPCFLLLFSSTNLADIKDINEDFHNNINTIPVVFGKKNTQLLILFSLAVSSYMFGTHPHYYDRPLINSFIEIQNAFISIITYFL